MKKALALIIACVVAFSALMSLAACGGSKTKDAASSDAPDTEKKPQATEKAPETTEKAPDTTEEAPETAEEAPAKADAASEAPDSTADSVQDTESDGGAAIPDESIYAGIWGQTAIANAFELVGEDYRCVEYEKGSDPDGRSAWVISLQELDNADAPVFKCFVSEHFCYLEDDAPVTTAS